MKCSLPQSYVDELPARIAAKRREVLLSMMPSGVTGGGSDNWWDGGYVAHEGGGHYYSGNRWHAESAPVWVGVTDDGKRISVTFTVTNTHAMTGETYPCDICNGSGTS